MRRPRHTTTVDLRNLTTRLLILLAAIGLVAAACGSTDDEATQDSEDAAAADETADRAEADGADTGDDGMAGASDAGTELAAEAPATTASPGPDDGTDDDATAQGEAGDDESAADGDNAEALGSGGAAPAQRTAADFGRKIIFTADITVEVDDVAAAGRQATTIIEGVGGFVFGQQTEGGSEPRSVLVFKVLPEDFDRAVEALGAVGELRNQTISADDVTERVVDLETRIEVAELGVERLRETLTQTRDLQDYAELERLLLERESELEVMRGQLRTLQDRIDLATVTLTLVQDAVNHSVSINTTLYHTHDGGVSCPGNDEWAVDGGTDLTLCIEIINTGEEPLADLAVIDTALGIDSADQLTLVYGELDRLDAGQSVMLAHEMSPDRPVRIRTKVTARPITDEGESAGPPVDATYQDTVEVAESGDDPGFGDGFDAGLSVLRGIWTVATVAIGFALPLLVLLAVIGPLSWLARGWIGDRLRSRRRSRLASAPPPAPPGSNPPPPPPGADGSATATTSGDAPPPGAGPGSDE